MGCISPIGNAIDTVWQSLKQGVSGIGHCHDDFTELLRTSICGYAQDTSAFEEDKTLKRMDPFIKYGVWAADQCMKQAGYQASDFDPYRIGALIGTGIGGLSLIEKNHAIALEKPNRISPFFIPSTIPNMASGLVSLKYGLKGPSFSLSSACASGTHAISVGAMMIESGTVDAMVVGGAEKASDLLGLSGFSAMRALSTQNDHPTQASRPWDKNRDGFVLADGAGVLMLEEKTHALARGAPILAELAGYGFSSDANHITQPDESGAAAIYAMNQALSKAGIGISDIGYINAHATSTPLGDVIEAKAIESFLGVHADQALVSSTKSMHGHLLGAAGALEAIISVMALQHQIAPPTINLDETDFETSLNLVPNQSQSFNAGYALSNSFGFGGTNGCIIIKKGT